MIMEFQHLQCSRENNGIRFTNKNTGQTIWMHREEFKFFARGFLPHVLNIADALIYRDGEGFVSLALSDPGFQNEVRARFSNSPDQPHTLGVRNEQESAGDAAGTAEGNRNGDAAGTESGPAVSERDAESPAEGFGYF